jgi:CBS domain-containing protein
MNCTNSIDSRLHRRRHETFIGRVPEVTMGEQLGHLRIHVRRVISGDGTLTSDSEVYCPPRDRSVAVGICEACRDYAGTGIDHSRTYVRCARLTPESARSLRAARHAWAQRRAYVEATSAGDRTCVGAIMRDEVVCVREQLSVEKLRRLLFDRGFSAVPVVNGAGEPIGVVSLFDLMRVPDGSCVRDVMTRVTFAAPDTMSVSQAAALMAYENLDRLPVVSEDGKVVGMVSSIDILRWLARIDGYLAPDR